MRVPLDHPGDQRGAGELDDPGARGHSDAGPGRGNPVALDEDGPARVWSGVHAVEDLRGAEEDGVGQGRRGDRDGGEQQGQAAHDGQTVMGLAFRQA